MKKYLNVEKFTYLIGYLEKASLRAVENLPLTNDTYIQAWKLLKEKYGNPQLIISRHMMLELLKAEFTKNILDHFLYRLC